MPAQRGSKAQGLNTYLRGLSPVTLTAAALLFISALAVSAHAWLGSIPVIAGKTASVAKPAQPSRPATAVPQESLQAEIVTIRQTGFEPQQLTRPHGRFILMVENRSGLGDIALQLHRQTGNSLHAVHVSKEQLDWHDEINLPPGNYVLTEANHPEWVCQITITPQ